MASSCGLHAHPGTFFVKILEQMSMVTLEIFFWAQLQKVLCFLTLFSRTISTLTFFPANSTKERKKQVRITRANPFILGSCLRDEEGGWGRASILSVMPNVAPDNMLSRLVITFLPRSKRLLISWLQSPSTNYLYI